MENSVHAAIQKSVERILSCISKRVSSTDLKRIEDAYSLAYNAHKEQRRKSGEPYIIHPIAVASILAEELELGANPVIAAFLHDVVEDTNCTIEQIAQLFGDDVAFLVGVVTKQKKERYNQSKQIDNYRQILSSVQYDIRAILIKLADRLHNMRTLDSMPTDKQMKIAGETDYFYAPLANRLGMYHIKTELENLSFRYRCPREYASLESMLLLEQEHNRRSIESFTQKITELLQAESIDAGIEIRYRTPYSVWRKMQSNGCDFNHVDGKHYIRIIYKAANSQEEKRNCLHIYATISDHFKERPGSVSNYINAPKENGYQSFHVKLLNTTGAWEEIHISSERMVRASRLGCTAERTEENISAWLSKFKLVLQDVANNNKGIDYMDGVTSSFYNDDIMTFTLDGKGVILPKGASALDFAYEIDSNMGNHAIYARVNGKLTSVKTRLHRGDCVEIGTEPNAQPEAEWLNHVLTYKAKRHLQNFVANRPVIEYKRCTSCHPLPGDEVVGFKDIEGSIVLHKRNCPTAIRQASQHGDSIIDIDFCANDSFLYPVSVRIRGIDRYHLLSDLVHCITDIMQLSIDRLHTETIDRIVECTIDFSAHSVDELHSAILSLSQINGIDEVYPIDIEN